MSSTKALAAICLLLFCAACGSAFRPEPRPAEVAHLDIMRKQEYILAAKTTLKTFRAAARDLRSRQRPIPLRELAVRFEEYFHLQVAPIVDDSQAESNLTTRLEVVKLQLLSGQIYLELTETSKARELLTEMQRQYGNSPEFIRAPLDRGDIGVLSLEQGLQELEKKIADAGRAAPAARTDRLVEPRKEEDPWNRIYSMPYPKRLSVP